MKYQTVITDRGNRIDPVTKYPNIFFLKIPTNFAKVVPQESGRKRITISESYIDTLRNRNTPEVLTIRDGGVISSNFYLDKFIFEVTHKKNCQSNKTTYYISFKKSL